VQETKVGRKSKNAINTNTKIGGMYGAALPSTPKGVGFRTTIIMINFITQLKNDYKAEGELPTILKG